MQSLNREVNEATLMAISARYVDLDHDVLRGVCCVGEVQDVGQTVLYPWNHPRNTPSAEDPPQSIGSLVMRHGHPYPPGQIVRRSRTSIHS
jgi:hypothetical protein